MTVETTSLSPEVDAPIAEGQPAQPQEVTEVTPGSEAQTPEAKADKPEANPVQKRIDQLTWKAHEAERRANAAIMAQQEDRQRLAQYEQQWQELQRRAAQPRFEQYGDPEQFQRATEAYNQQVIAQERQRFMQAQQAQQQAIAQQQFQQALNARVVEAGQKYADFNEVVSNPNLPNLQTVNPPVLSAILEHEHFPDIAYYLGKNPNEAHRIAGLPPARAILEVGRIAATLTAKPRQSQASAPPATVGTTKGSADKDPNDMTYDEFVKWRRRSIAQRR